MGIYIKGMEIPEGTQTKVVVLLGKTARADGKDYPVISVPPHGDLIDRYDLKNKKITIDYNERDDTFDDGIVFVTDLIDNAPTIIEAEVEGNDRT